MGACLSICRKAPPDDTTAKLNGAVAKTEEAAAAPTPAPENSGVDNQAFEDEKGKGLLVVCFITILAYALPVLIVWGPLSRKKSGLISSVHSSTNLRASTPNLPPQTQHHHQT